MIDAHNLSTHKTTVFLQTQGSGAANVVEDFHFSGDRCPVILTPESHFGRQGSSYEPYSAVFYSLSGKRLDTVYTGHNINLFNLAGSGGAWASITNDTTQHGVFDAATGKGVQIPKGERYAFVTLDYGHHWVFLHLNFHPYIYRGNQIVFVQPYVRYDWAVIN